MASQNVNSSSGLRKRPSETEQSNSKSGKPLSASQVDLESFGLARKARRILRERFKDVGINEAILPDQLKDKLVAKSRKGKIGAIIVREFSGVQSNGASKLVRRMEHELTQGHDDIIETFEAIPDLPKTMQHVLEIMKAKPQISFARAIAEAKADPAVALDTYGKGVMALNKMGVLINLYRSMPAIFRDIMRHAIDKEEVCDVCLGQKKVQPRQGVNVLSVDCPRCKGSGLVLTSSEHKEFAMQKALEMSEMLPKKGPLVAVQQNQVNVNSSDGGLLEKMSKAADEILYNRKEVVDAEIVESEGE